MSNLPRYFTIQTIKGSGLGDQLGTQFTRLYGLGKVLGAFYIYSPVSFYRSVKPGWYELSQSLFFQLRCFMFFLFGQSLFSSALNVVLLRMEKRLDKLQEKYEDTYLSSFLGLKYVSEGDISLITDALFCDIYIDELLERKSVKSMADLQSYVTSQLKDKPDRTILRFIWTGEMWSLIPQIDKLLKETGLQKETIQQKIFSEGFWKQHGDVTSDKINIVFHIRCGDSTTIRLGDRSLIVYDKFLYQSEKEMNEILQIDPDRISVLPEEYLKVFNQIIPLFDKNDITISVISDGYTLTYRHILRNLLKRKCSMRLSFSEKRMLWKKIRQKNRIFNQFENAHLIIGENRQKLEKSILALASADVVIWGCGGFACNTHYLFKKVNNQSIVINVKNFSEKELDQLKNRVNA